MKTKSIVLGALPLTARQATIDGVLSYKETVARPKAYRGVFYYASYDDARIVRDNLRKANPLARIIGYERGYAIQRERSGRYFGPGRSFGTTAWN